MPDLSPIELFTPRLRLRPLLETDADDYFAVFADPQVARYLGRPAWTERRQASEQIARMQAHQAEGVGLRMAIELRASGRLIGDACLFHFDDANRRCETGYSLASAHWGQGYASEAMAALLGYGFDTLDLNRVEADVDPRNLASARVLEKLGFRKEGYLPERWIVDGVTADTVLYGLLRSYWRARG